MKLIFFKVLLITLISFLFSSTYTQISSSKELITNSSNNNYQAIVLGEIIKKEIKKIRGFYLTEYKLKTKKWLFKNPEVKESKFLTIKVLGAELKDKGIVIKASNSPDYVPIRKEAIFFLENTKKKQKNVFTLSKNGVIVPVNNLYVKQIQDYSKQKKEL